MKRNKVKNIITQMWKSYNSSKFYIELAKNTELLGCLESNSSYLDNATNAERVFNIMNDLYSVPLCNCGKKCKFINTTRGYTENCSYKCMGSQKHVLTLDSYQNLIKPLGLQCIEIVDVTTPVLHTCKCGNTFKKRPATVLYGRSQACKKCKDNRLTKSHSVYVNEVAEKFPDILVIGTYKNAKTKIIHKHECGYEWFSRPNDILNGYHCPICFTGLYRSGKEKPQKFGLIFDSYIELRCAEVLVSRYGLTDIEFKKRYDTSTRRNCDFYIKSRDLWIETSNFNFPEYLERIWNKRRLVKNFIFAYSEINLTELLNELQY